MQSYHQEQYLSFSNKLAVLFSLLIIENKALVLSFDLDILIEYVTFCLLRDLRTLEYLVEALFLRLGLSMSIISTNHLKEAPFH